jgi:hypothetical protein
MGEMMVQRYRKAVGKSERKRCENLPNVLEDNIKMNLTGIYFGGVYGLE